MRGSRSRCSRLDVTDDASARSALNEVLARHGRIDVLVNNEGVGLSGAIEDFPEDQARASLETNFWGPVRMIRLVLPTMRAQGSGVIVNISSITGRLPSFPCYGFYAAGKHALGAMSESLAEKSRRSGSGAVRRAGLLPHQPDRHGRRVGRAARSSSPYADLGHFMLDFTKRRAGERWRSGRRRRRRRRGSRR